MSESEQIATSIKTKDIKMSSKMLTSVNEINTPVRVVSQLVLGSNYRISTQ